jgi:hypothetical protein
VVVDLTRNALLLEEVGDDLLGIVCGASVANDPIVNVLVY